MSETIIYHNPACGTSRKVLGMLRENGRQPRIIEYLKTPPTREELVSLLARMGKTPRDILRRKNPLYTGLGLDNPAISNDSLLDALILHPVLLERPIVLTAHGVRLCRPADRVAGLFGWLGSVDWTWVNGGVGGWGERPRATATGVTAEMCQADVLASCAKLACSAVTRSADARG